VSNDSKVQKFLIGKNTKYFNVPSQSSIQQ